MTNVRSATLDAVLTHSGSGSFQLPWEIGVFAEIFGTEHGRILPMVERVADPGATIEKAEASTCSPMVESVSGAHNHSRKLFLGHAVSTELGRVHPTPEEQLSLMAQRFELILAHSFEASVLGRRIQDLDREERLAKIELALGGKSLGTLKKRYGQAARFVTWANGENMVAFPIAGQVAEEYLQHLSTSAARHSALTGAIESMNFLHHVLGVDMDPRACLALVVQGILRKARKNRPPKKQARALKVCELLDLENALTSHDYSAIDRFCIGCFLAAVYGRARLGDLRVIEGVLLDFTENQADSCGYLEVVSLSHKCSMASNRQGLRLHLVIPAKGIGPRCWGRDFVQVAKECGRDLDKISSGEPLLYMPDVHGGFSDVPAETATFTAWIAEILGTMPSFCGERITGHTAKHTLLEWMGKAGLDLDNQSLLGHHVLVGRNSALTYARDQQSSPVRKLEAMLSDVRLGVFLPDVSRSGMFAKNPKPLGIISLAPQDQPGESGQAEPSPVVSEVGESTADRVGLEAEWELPNASENMSEEMWYKQLADDDGGAFSDAPDDAIGLGVFDEDPAAEDSFEPGSSSSSESSSDESLDEKVQACGALASSSRSDVGAECSVYQNRMTKKLHLLPRGSSSNKFVCGRLLDDKHREFVGGVMVASMKCISCHRGKPINDVGALCHALDAASKRRRTSGA